MIAFLTAGVSYDIRFGRNLDSHAQCGEPVDSTSLRYRSENIFRVPNKIIRLLNKRGFCSHGDGWSCAGCDGARVKSGLARSCAVVEKGSVTRPIRENGGEILTEYYFGEANITNNRCNHHSNATNKIFNWGGIFGLLQYNTTNK